VLIQREVLQFSAAETAGILDTTPASVNSALQRARRTVEQLVPKATQQPSGTPWARRAGASWWKSGSSPRHGGLLAAGLVDELHLMIGAVVLGGGTPAFGLEQVPALRLLGTTTWEGTDNMPGRYAPADRCRPELPGRLTFSCPRWDPW
jgi:RibD domain-containing protein/sigma-70-like protein